MTDAHTCGLGTEKCFVDSAVSDRLQSAHVWIGLFYNGGFTALWVSACKDGM